MQTLQTCYSNPVTVYLKQPCAKAQVCQLWTNPLRDMDQLGAGVDWECRTGAPPPPVRQGLDRKAFERAPEGAMRELLAYVRANHGGLHAWVVEEGRGGGGAAHQAGARRAGTSALAWTMRAAA